MPRFVCQFTDNGEPIIPAEWWMVPEFNDLARAHDKRYLGLIVMLHAYRSPYRMPSKELSIAQRLDQILTVWNRRYGQGFTPTVQVITGSLFTLASETLLKGQFDPLWEELVIMEQQEEQLLDAIRELSFSGYEPEPEPEEDPGLRYSNKPGPKPTRTPKAPKPTALVSAQVVKSQSESLRSLMETKSQVSNRAEFLRGLLWREVKSKRTARASQAFSEI